jgi:RHS repeat-associated protein
MTDTSGKVVWSARYSAFGQANVVQERVAQPWRLAGHYHDDETGLHYVTARYYNPALGHFLSPDPIGPEGGSRNLYLYCDGDPINRLDPSGEFIFTAIVVGALIGAAIGAGIEAYRQYKSNGEINDGWAVAKAALVGGVIGAIGGGVGAAVEAAVGATTLAGLAGAGALSGVASAAVEQCAEMAITGTPVGPTEFLTNVLIGGAIGTVTAGIGGLYARRARRAMQQAVETGSEEAGEAVETLARRAGAPNAETAARSGEPSAVYTRRTSEIPYHHPPEMRRVRPGQALDVDQMDPNQTYLWAVDPEGNVMVAPERQAGFGANDHFPDGRPVKHGDLVPGEGGQTRGAARSGGELQAVRDGDGNPTGLWVMNNDSSYTFARTDGNLGTEENLRAAHELLSESGTDTSRIIPVNTSGQ